MVEIYLTPEQVAERLQLSPITIRRQRKRAVLRGIKKGRVWRVPERAVSDNAAPKASAITRNRWQQDAARMAASYERAFARVDDLTAITAAPGDFEALRAQEQKAPHEHESSAR